MAEGFAKKLLRDAEAEGLTLGDMNLFGVNLVQHMLQATNVTPAPPTDKVYLL